MVIIVLILCGPGELVGSIDQAIASLGVAAVGVLSLVAVRLVERPLDCSTDDTLMASFRQRLFVRIAFASLPVLVGFVGVLLSAEPAPYVIGLAFAEIGLARTAPTRQSIERDQEALSGSGCPRSLGSLLYRPAPAGPG